MEAMNAELIREGLSQSERLRKLNIAAIAQIKSLSANKSIKLLNELSDA